MKIITKAKNLEISESLQKFIDEKIGSLKKFINILKQDTPEKGKTLAEVFVEIEKETEHHKNGKIFSCQLGVKLPGKNLLIIKTMEDDLFNAITKARDGFKMEIEKYKVKNIEKRRRQQKKLKKEINV